MEKEPKIYSKDQAHREASILSEKVEMGGAKDYFEAEQLLAREVEEKKKLPLPDRITKNSLAMDSEEVRHNINHDSGLMGLNFLRRDAYDRKRFLDDFLVYEEGGIDKVTYYSPEKRRELEMRGYRERDWKDYRTPSLDTYTYGEISTYHTQGSTYEQKAKNLGETIKNSDIVDYYLCNEESLIDLLRQREELDPDTIANAYDFTTGLLEKLSSDIGKTTDEEKKQKLMDMKTRMESLVQPLEEKLKTWEEFKKSYGDLVKGSGWGLTGESAAEKILAEAEKRGSIKSAKIPGRDEYIFVGEVEVIHGWKVVATFTAKENRFPNATELSVDEAGEFFELDNRGTSWDPLSLNKNSYQKGKEAPEDAYRFGEFSNSNNYGYRWISPNPFIKGAQPQSFSSTWGKQVVHLIPPKGSYTASVMDGPDKRFSKK